MRKLLLHLLLIAGVVYSLYPILWVVSVALTPGGNPEPRAIPFPSHPTLDNFRDVTGTGIFGNQVVNSVVVSLATASVAVAIATPAAYAIAHELV